MIFFCLKKIPNYLEGYSQNLSTMPRCTALVYPGTTNQRQCLNNSKFRVLYLNEDLYPNGIEKTLCGVHLNTATTNTSNARITTTFDSRIRRSREEKLYSVSNFRANTYPEIRPWTESLIEYNSDMYMEMMLRARDVIRNRGLLYANPAPARANQLTMGERAAARKVVGNNDPPPPAPEEPQPVYLEDPSKPIKEGETRDCSICMAEPGTVICSENRHTMCKGCFEEHALVESSDPSFDGELLCCASKAFGCKAKPFSSFLVIREISETKAKRFFHNVSRSQERAAVVQFQRLELEKKERETKSNALSRIREHVVDDILTLRCPNPSCRMAFVDFTGCMALQCPRCKAGICGKCFKRFGKNAHPHIQRGECTVDSKREFFGDATYIKHVQQLYKTTKLNQYMGTLDPSLAKEFLRIYANEIKEGGVNI